MKIVVYGNPAPQGSKKFMGRSTKTGRGILVESSKAVKPWREAVKNAAIEALSQSRDPLDPASMLRGPIRLSIVFTVAKPKSAPKTRVTFPDRKPDLSKFIRSTEDALTDAGVWEDDARVVTVCASKVYPGQGRDSLNIPGAVIWVDEFKI
jgi:Holliday junction resolvase RusA-like endonuclease